ncbi:hypothetical protein GW879_02200, partial [Candidatus Kaiserbacteria bacterium]|nr:hypothetical protein [Candidatus Kaiserbacteria bacterium]
ESAQDSLFSGEGGGGIGDLTLIPAPAAPSTQKLIWEKDLLGVYVSGHPLNDFTEEMKKRPSIGNIRQAIANDDELAIARLKGTLVTAGMISSVRELITKKGDKMAFLVLADQKDT